ncbi:MAG: hypothetical protein ABSG56_07520 [Bryobacteraceae bacterium]|jgi:hypothetical protein
MRKYRVGLWLAAVAVVSGAGCQSALAQNKFEVVTGKAFDSAVPKDFYLEGNAIPTEKRNAVLVKSPAGARALFALIDTTGYAASIKAKYVGMIVTEGDLTLCGHKVTVGSYGFGWELPGTGVDAPGKFSLYNQAGAAVADCTAERQADLKLPRPLQVVVAPDGSARLYHGKHYVALQ